MCCVIGCAVCLCCGKSTALISASQTEEKKNIPIVRDMVWMAWFVAGSCAFCSGSWVNEPHAFFSLSSSTDNFIWIMEYNLVVFSSVGKCHEYFFVCLWLCGTENFCPTKHTPQTQHSESLEHFCATIEVELRVVWFFFWLLCYSELTWQKMCKKTNKCQRTMEKV